jgi:hypothetical protein
VFENSSIGLFALIALLFGIADLAVSHQEKESIRMLMLKGWFAIDRNDPEPRMRHAANSILSAFDIVFGIRHFTWRCFAMSALFSASFILLLSLALSRSIESYYAARATAMSYAVLSSAVVAAVYNIPLDYAFLLKARWILSKARRLRPRLHPLLLALDALSTLVLVSIPIIPIGILAVTSGVIPEQLRNATNAELVGQVLKEAAIFPLLSIRALLDGGHAVGGVPMFGLSVVSTLSTSLIFFLYNALATLVSVLAFGRIRLLNTIDGVFSSKTLFTSIGLVFAGAAVVVKWRLG